MDKSWNEYRKAIGLGPEIKQAERDAILLDSATRVISASFGIDTAIEQFNSLNEQSQLKPDKAEKLKQFIAKHPFMLATAMKNTKWPEFEDLRDSPKMTDSGKLL